MAQMRNSSALFRRAHLDLPLVLGLLLISIYGLVVLYSAGGEDIDLVIRQGLRLLVGFTVMGVVAQLAPRHLFHWTPWLYISGLALLGAVLVAGDMGKGAQRWLHIGSLNFQPSEMLKVIVPMMVAYFVVDKPLPPSTARVLAASVLLLVPSMLIAVQPDLGTASLIAASGFFVLLLAGMRWRLIGGLALALSAFAPLLWYQMHDYQRQRVLTFLDPEKDPLGSGYHIIQSKIAIGSGGFYGKGWLNGTQSQLDFLPERATDFVFAVLGEEFGLLGICLLLALYLFVVLRGLYLAIGTQDVFGRLLGGSLVLTFFIYVFINIGMVSGLLPVVGLPLPLVSYGGTSLVTVMAAFGILMCFNTHRRLLSP
jgi:rod shape determining protein RodA